MAAITLDEARPLIGALNDPNPTVRLQALRALVRLPLDQEAWREVGNIFMVLLHATPEGEFFYSQTLDGIPLLEVIEAAALVPVKSVRQHLHGLLEAEDSGVQRFTAQVLAKVRDQTALARLLADLTVPEVELHREAAEYLSLLDVSPELETIREAYRQETDGDTRFLLAVALAQAGEAAELVEVYRQVQEGSLESSLVEYIGSPWVADILSQRGPFPGEVRELLKHWEQEEDSRFAWIANVLGWANQRLEAMEAEPPPGPPPGDIPEQVLHDLLQGLEEGNLELLENAPENFLTYFPEKTASRLITILFQEKLRRERESGYQEVANDVIYAVNPLGRQFTPDIPGLMGCYGKARGNYGLSQQIAWVISRADVGDIVPWVNQQVRAPDPEQRVWAAQLLEDVSRYARQDYGPIFGGGSGPPEVPPPATFIDEREFHTAMMPEMDDVEDGIPVGRDHKRSKPPMARPESGPPARVVSTGFAPEASPDQAVDPHLPLQAGAVYFFWLEIGAPQEKSIEETPVDIPPVPAQARLTVALFGFAGELEITPATATGELMVQADGTVKVTRQPLAESLPASERLQTRLFFPVRPPGQNGSYRLRCHIYWGQILLQSRVIHALVRQRPRRRQRPTALRSLLDYTLSQTLAPAHLNQFGEHRLSVFMNRNGDGTHSFHLYGSDGQTHLKQDDIRFREGELQGMIAQARGTLRIASWGRDEEWQEGVPYKYKNRQRDLDRLKNDLSNMACWGYEFYTLISDRLAGGMEKVADFENLLLKPGTVQLAMKESPSYVLPAALTYDYPLDTGLGSFSLCPSFTAAWQQGQPLGEHECFQGNCPTREDLTTICPSGFWGFRHYLGMPLSVGQGPDAPAVIPVDQEVRLAVIVATDLQLLPDHTKALQGLRPQLVWNYADRREEAFRVLLESPHLVYFYCHGGQLRGMPYLRVGTDDRINRSNLFAHKVQWQAPRPLIFINGCHTAAVEPLQALEFISPLVTYSHSAGVIGTEITIFEELATVFAQECFRLFFLGQPIGAALRGARL
ncbi:MAG: hypothetical protein FJ135_11845, partial [Deltaproteobacteria bacterium]|nr:hypothetical protein [Deltaproteobacteria bacterium]